VHEFVSDGFASEAKLSALRALAEMTPTVSGPKPPGKLFVFSADGDHMMPRSFAERLLLARYGGVDHVDFDGGDATVTAAVSERRKSVAAPCRPVVRGVVRGFSAAAVAQAAAKEEAKALEAKAAAAEASGGDAEGFRSAADAARLRQRVARLEGLAARWATVAGGHGVFFGDQPLASEKYRLHLEDIGLVASRSEYLAALKEARAIANAKGRRA